MGLSTDFMGIIPDWELVVLLLFLAIFVLVCVMACIKCTQFACEEPEISCPKTHRHYILQHGGGRDKERLAESDSY